MTSSSRRNLALGRRTVLAGAVATCIIIAACGSSSGSGGSKAAGSGASSSGGGCDKAYAQQQINRYEQIPAFTTPGPAFDPSKARGKTVFNIQETSANPFTQAITGTMRKVAAQYGLKFTDYPNQGQHTQWAQGVQEAINTNASLITLVGGTISPFYFKPQAEAAAKAGIPIVTVLNEDLTQPAGYKVTARVAQPYEQSARLDADWAIAQTNCKADVLVLTSQEVIGSPVEVAALKDEFAKRCGGGCKLTFQNAPVPDWPTKVQGLTQSAIQSDPNLNYVIPLYDGMTQFVLPGIQAAGAAGRVKVATFNGTPFALKDIQDHTAVAMDVGENEAQVGYAAMDQAMRLLSGNKPIASGNEHIPLRVFDSSNVSQTGTPPVLGKGYGNAFLQGYTKMWAAK